MDAAQVASRNTEVPRRACAHGKQHDVEGPLQVLGRQIVADRNARFKANAFATKLVYSSVNNPFFKLEIGDPVPEYAAGPVGFFKHRDRMPQPPQFLGGRYSRWARSDNGHLLSGFALGRPGNDPSLLEGIFNDRKFNLFDSHGAIVDRKRTACFARSRTDASRYFRKVIGHFKPPECFLPLAAVHKVVPFGNEVIDRAPHGVTKGNAAVHAAAAL